MKELILGYLFTRNYIFTTDVPRVRYFPSEYDMVQGLGYRKPTFSDPREMREDYKDTSKRIQATVKIIFAIMLSDAYIARYY